MELVNEMVRLAHSWARHGGASRKVNLEFWLTPSPAAGCASSCGFRKSAVESIIPCPAQLLVAGRPCIMTRLNQILESVVAQLQGYVYESMIGASGPPMHRRDGGGLTRLSTMAVCSDMAFWRVQPPSAIQRTESRP